MSKEKEKEIDICKIVDNLKIFIGDKMESIEYKIDKPSLPFTAMFDKLGTQIENADLNIRKFSKMLNELKGCIAMSRSVLKERNDLTPRWYRLDNIETPSRGEIWVKDLDGNETIAACRGKAIMFPAGSSVKEPIFWKPV